MYKLHGRPVSMRTQKTSRRTEGQKQRWGASSKHTDAKDENGQPMYLLTAHKLQDSRNEDDYVMVSKLYQHLVLLDDHFDVHSNRNL